MVDLRGALNGVGAAADVAGSGLGWMGHEALQQPARAGAFLGGLSHRSNVDWQADFLAKDLRDRGVPEAAARALALDLAHSLDINTSERRQAAVQVGLNRYRADVHRHG